MIALDTNVLARFLLADNPGQARAARLLLENGSEQFWFPVTVVLELTWVLCGKGVPPTVLIGHIRKLLSMPGVHAQMPAAISEGLRSAERGVDLADALHLALSAKADHFATFDNALFRSARKIGAKPPVMVP